MPLILVTALVWGRAGAGRGCVPRMLGRKPKCLNATRLALCDLLPSPSYSLSHTSLLSALGTNQTLSCLRAFAHVVSFAQNALLSSLLPLLCPQDDCFSLVALCSESCCGFQSPPLSICSVLPLHCSLASGNLDPSMSGSFLPLPSPLLNTPPPPILEG